jgi:hypothetical protein
LFTLGSFCTEVTHFWGGHFIHGKKYVLYLTEMFWAIFLGGFFTNSSGRPDGSDTDPQLLL